MPVTARNKTLAVAIMNRQAPVIRTGFWPVPGSPIIGKQSGEQVRNTRIAGAKDHRKPMLMREGSSQHRKHLFMPALTQQITHQAVGGIGYSQVVTPAPCKLLLAITLDAASAPPPIFSMNRKDDPGTCTQAMLQRPLALIVLDQSTQDPIQTA